MKFSPMRKINLCGNGGFNSVLVERCYEAADVIKQLVKERDKLQLRLMIAEQYINDLM